jgi:predicted RNase H-like HicB family nuclease
MYPYKCVITTQETSDGTIFIAEYPAFKYVTGGGHTIEEAIDELNTMVGLAIETLKEKDWPIPTPDADINIQDYSGKLVLRLSKRLHKDLAEMASEENVSLNTYMIEALTAYVNRGKAIVKSLTVNED